MNLKRSPAHLPLLTAAFGLPALLALGRILAPDAVGAQYDAAPRDPVAPAARPLADPAVPEARRARPLRASSSMPYFSFAHSLRPRG